MEKKREVKVEFGNNNARFLFYFVFLKFNNHVNLQRRCIMYTANIYYINWKRVLQRSHSFESKSNKIC